MIEVISIRFKNKGKVYFFDSAGLTVPTGVHVIVETSKGLEYAECTCGNHFVEDTAIIPPLRPVVRIATAEDNKKSANNKAKEAEAFTLCHKKIDEHGLDMKLVDVEFSFEGSKILFFFTSDGRVDFRELVKDLASVFKTRIELRQIGVRDEARMLGGLGICGRQFCCTQFLEEFHPVSIKMAKVQGLSLNPVKISGTCGRLMCCLKYEQSAYEELVKKAPKSDAFVETPDGKASVIGVNLLRGTAKVRPEEGMDSTYKTFNFSELEVLGGKARRAEFIAARAEGRLEEAGFTTKPVQVPKPLIKSELSSNLKTGAISNQSPFKKNEPYPRNNPKRHKKPQKPLAGPEKRQVAPKEPVPTSGDKPPVAKTTKRRHRGGRNRNRSGGQKPSNTAPSGSAPKPE